MGRCTRLQGGGTRASQYRSPADYKSVSSVFSSTCRISPSVTGQGIVFRGSLDNVNVNLQSRDRSIHERLHGPYILSFQPSLHHPARLINACWSLSNHLMLSRRALSVIQHASNFTVQLFLLPTCFLVLPYGTHLLDY